MAKRQSEAAAGLLTAWTDADTAMQIVGTSLGVFDSDTLDPTVVLASETPLRNALFDILLSLVEGHALEMRPTDGGRYAFRWREDIAIAGVAPEGATTIDLAPPSPYLEELERVRAERDAAIARAELAEALAAERERLLRLAGVPGPGEPVPAGTDTAPPRAVRKSPARKATRTKPARAAKTAKAEPVTAAAPEPAGTGSDQPAPNDAEARDTEANEVLYLTPPAAGAPPETEPQAKAQPAETVVPAAPAEPDGRAQARAKWSGYAVEPRRPRAETPDHAGDAG